MGNGIDSVYEVITGRNSSLFGISHGGLISKFSTKIEMINRITYKGKRLCLNQPFKSIQFEGDVAR
jgi:hypothetical protein